jgi:hypothetical protein
VSPFLHWALHLVAYTAAAACAWRLGRSYELRRTHKRFNRLLKALSPTAREEAQTLIFRGVTEAN